MTRYDVAVIGAGSAGEKIARSAGKAGRRVALVEEHLVGGECPYYACIPSKGLLRPAHLLAEVRAVPGMTASIEAGEMLAWRDDLVHHLEDSAHVGNVDFDTVTLYRERGRLDGAGHVRIGDDTVVEAEHVVISTGARPAIPAIPGLVEYETSHDLTVTRDVPSRLLVLGGGFIGCELSQAFAALGSRVTIVDRGPALIDEEEPEACRHVTEGLEAFGVETRLNTTIVEIRRGDGAWEAITGSGRVIGYDRLLLATGREPNLDDVGLETVGLSPEPAPSVDDDLRIGERLYLVGDANGQAAYTHAASSQANLVTDLILRHPPRRIPASISGDRSPRILFTHPTVAAVGVTSDAVPEGGRVARFDMGTVPASNTLGRGVVGFACLVVDHRDRLVGATFVSPLAAEMLQAATLAVVNQLTVARMRPAMSAYPTLADVWAPLLAQL